MRVARKWFMVFLVTRRTGGPESRAAGAVDDEVAVVLQHQVGARVAGGVGRPAGGAVPAVEDEVAVAPHDGVARVDVANLRGRRARRPQRRAALIVDEVVVALEDQAEAAVG